MIIKKADDRTSDIGILKGMLERPDTTTNQKENIEREIRFISAGIKGENGTAYQLEFYWSASKSWAIIHDLRLEHNGQVAQIDHLLINRLMQIYVCESKHFSEGVSIDEYGQFTAFFKGKPSGQPSPIEQNRRHIKVLQDICNAGRTWLPTRIGFTIKPEIKSLVLISKNARISRPKKKFEWLDEIIKADEIKTRIDRNIDDLSPLIIGKLINEETLYTFAGELATLHQPIKFDWHAKFGLSKETSLPTKPAEQFKAEEKPKKYEAIKNNTCKHCDSTNIEVNHGKFGYYIRCLQCDKNTAIKTFCTTCNRSEKIRKAVNDFFAECAHCNTSRLFHKNA